MYKIFEKFDNVTYYLVYVSDDLDLATQFLSAYRKKYSDRKYVMFQYII